MSAALSAPALAAPVAAPRQGRVQRAVLGIWVASGFLAFIEPSPYEVMFFVALAVLVATGLAMVRDFVPLVVLLLLYNIGGAISLIPHIDEPKPVQFVAVSFYLAVTTIVFACALGRDTEGRAAAIESGAVAGGVLASLAAVAGFFDVAGVGELFAQWGETRASGTFKDPNVLGPFLVFPTVILLQRLLLGRTRRPVLTLALLLLVCFALFLTFSRGAWADMVLATAMLLVITFLLTPHARMRRRVVMASALALAAITVALAVALADDRIRQIFEMRASLNQHYDVGVTGRFGNQLRSLPLLFDNPQGIGPLKFPMWFRDAPHNVYLNAFHAYGWLGGISYIALIGCTVYVGFQSLLLRSPWQASVIAAWCALFPQIVQGFQIDTDHWRHLMMLMGVTWGLAAANRRWRLAQAAGAASPR